MNWRLIGPEKHDAFMNLALEEACISSVKSGKVLPTIRFYEWKNSSVVVGYFQKILDELDISACEKNKIDVTRRITGGGAMYLDTVGEVTFSVIAPASMLPGINESYREVCGWLVNGLKNIGLSAEFRPINDVIINEKKISGSAMTRRGNVVMLHGTLLHKVDPDRMFKFLTPSGKKLSDKQIKNIKEYVTAVSHHSEISKKELVDEIIYAFIRGKNIEESDWTRTELKTATALVDNKYKTKEWVFRR
ncbi:biotin/lipoate A/B protein ligase family protein [Candidatus Aenigmatarchaeota archaeon]